MQKYPYHASLGELSQDGPWSPQNVSLCQTYQYGHRRIQSVSVYFWCAGFSSVNMSLAELSVMGSVHHLFSLELLPKHYSDFTSVFT